MDDQGEILRALGQIEGKSDAIDNHVKAVSAKAGDNPFFFANFDDLSQITINSGDVVRVTPRIAFNVSAAA